MGIPNRYGILCCLLKTVERDSDCPHGFRYSLRNVILFTATLIVSLRSKSSGSIKDKMIAPSFRILPWVVTMNVPGLSAG